ncbi:MAG: hypothetical protein RL885_26605 [Planctomycetota bacterium]
MFRNQLTWLVLTGVALVSALAPSATAAGRNPGSLLVYPVYDSHPGSGTVISITNTKDAPSFNPNTNLNGVVDVHFIYIDGDNWSEFNRYERLTPNDTFTILANKHNPNSETGFLYCVALSPLSQQPVSHDWLIGDEIVADGYGNWLYGFDAIAFRAVVAAGSPTDVDHDGFLELNGIEYEAVADEMMISSFIAQGVVTSTLMLVSLAGNSDYRTTLAFEVFNNNEQEFSASYTFRCWASVELADIDAVFTDAFLSSTAYDMRNTGLTIGTTGWARIDGVRATDIVGNEPRITDPAFVGAIAQSIYGYADGHLLHESAAVNPTPGKLDSLQ